MARDVKLTVFQLRYILKDRCDVSYDVVFDINLDGNDNYKRIKLQDVIVSHVDNELRFKLSM